MGQKNGVVQNFGVGSMGCAGPQNFVMEQKVNVGKKQYSLLPFLFIVVQCSVSVPHMYSFRTFVSLYSLCSFHIYFGAGLKLYTDLNLPNILF